MEDSNKILGTFFGDPNFPIEWQNEEEKKLHWFYDDLHVPLPASPMYGSIGWWGDSCPYMYRRFGAPFGGNWTGKVVNGYIYTAIVPRDPEEAAKIAPYYNMVMPVYANNFLDWWHGRYLPEIKRNFDYMDNFPIDSATLPELMIYLEDCLDIWWRHFRLHWILNLAQFQSSLDFNATVAEVIGEVNPELLGRIQISIEDRNWDAIEELWKLKEQIKNDPELKSIFETGETAQKILPLLEANERGKSFLGKVQEYAQEYGYKTMYCHEFMYKQWIEDKTPIIESLKGYVATDYDFPSEYQSVKDDHAKAISELRALIPANATEDQKTKLENSLALVLKMMPLTPNHHFYMDQGTNARMRLMFIGIGRHLAKIGLLDDPEDIFFLEYEQLRWYVSNPMSTDNPEGIDGRAFVKQARQAREEAMKIRPVDWFGTVTHWSLYEEPYKGLWGFPEKFLMAEEKAKEPEDIIKGMGGSPGVVEGTARLVGGSKDFDEVKRGEIVVCIMTNPAWVMLFTKITGLVTDAGGVLSHPAVVSREFGIPAVVGTSNATKRIKTGDRIRINGSTGIVEILK